MTLRVKLFGPEAKAAGTREVAVTPVAGTCAALRQALAEKYPALSPLLANCRFAVNHEFVELDHTVKESDEIALIGMVSGG
jgi:molybdopterin converting factor small subunit